MTLQNRSPVRTDIEAKATKISNLQSSNPETFGNSSATKHRFEASGDRGNSKRMSQWTGKNFEDYDNFLSMWMLHSIKWIMLTKIMFK